MYIGDYTCEQGGCEESCHSKTCSAILLKYIPVVAAAEYYDIPQLGQLANEKILGVLREGVCSKHLPAAIDEAYSATNDKKLHEIISTIAADNIEHLLTREDFIGSKTMGQLPLDIMRKMIGRQNPH